MAREQHERVTVDLSRGGRVKQSFREESDVNVIMARWRHTGILPSATAKEPMYGDFSNALSYQEAADQVHAAERSFEALPPGIRARFNHNVKDLLEFMENPANEEEGRELGVIAPLEAESEPAAEPAEEPPS